MRAYRLYDFVEVVLERLHEFVLELLRLGIALQLVGRQRRPQRHQQRLMRITENKKDHQHD